MKIIETGEPLGEDAVVVCVLASAFSPFSDNKPATCADCRTALKRRPHWPDDATFVCEACGMKRLADDPDPEISTTRATMDEVITYLSSEGGTKQ